MKHLSRIPASRSAGTEAKAFAALAFIVPFLVRALPEILMQNFVVGFDTMSYYVPIVLKWTRGGIGVPEVTSNAPLLYVLLAQLVLSGVPFMALFKVFPSILHGLLGLSVYGYARKGLVWSFRKSLAVSLLAVLYFVSLRISWDMLRSELGLIFLFAFLILLRNTWKLESWKHSGLLLLVSVLVVLSHQLVSVVMLALVTALALRKLRRGEVAAVGKLLLSVLPALVLFGLYVYRDLVISPVPVAAAEWLSIFGSSSLVDGAVTIPAFILFCYLPLLPFLWLGYRGLSGNQELTAWVFWCLAAGLVGIVVPLAFGVASYRWILLLVFPLAFLAVEGFSRFRFRNLKVVWCGFLVFLSAGFVLLPAARAFPYFGIFPYYVPSSMLQNSVPLSDCEDVARALDWMSNSLATSDVLLVHDAFQGWASMCLSPDRRVVAYGYGDPEVAARSLTLESEGRVFVLWWVSGSGWHGQASLSLHFAEVFKTGRIAIYKFSESVVA